MLTIHGGIIFFPEMIAKGGDLGNPMKEEKAAQETSRKSPRIKNEMIGAH